jgi:hypothetical protein
MQIRSFEPCQFFLERYSKSIISKSSIFIGFISNNKPVEIRYEFGQKNLALGGETYKPLKTGKLVIVDL